MGLVPGRLQGWAGSSWRGRGGLAEPCLCLAADELFSGDNTVDLLIEDQLLRPSSRAGEPVRKPSPVGWPPTPGSAVTTLAAAVTTTVSPSPATPDPSTANQLIADPESVTAPAGLAEEGTPQLPSALASTVAATATEDLPTATPAGGWSDTESSPGAWVQANTPPTPVSPASPATPKEGLEEEDIRNIIGECLHVLHSSSCVTGAGSCPQGVLLGTAHLGLVTGERCHRGGSWTALQCSARCNY